MAEWTQEARRELDAYLARVADLCRAQGDDADEVVAGLREHIATEMAKDGAVPLVTAERVVQVLARLGTPEQVAGTGGAARPGHARAARQEGAAAASGAGSGGRDGRFEAALVLPGCFGWVFLLFAVVIPLAAIVLEATSHILAAVYLDPMPTAFHFAILLLIPLSYLFCAWHTARTGRARPRWMTTAAFVSNGYATAVSAVYLIINVPILPIAAVLSLVGIGLLGLSPVFCAAGGFWQMVLLHRRESGLSRGAAAWRTLAGAGIALAALGALTAPAFLTGRAIEMGLSEDSAVRARGIRLLRLVGGEDELLERCYGRVPRRGGEIFEFDGRATAGGEEACRELYFRATGRPYNSVPPPDRTVGARDRVNLLDSWQEDWMVDREVGGESVASRVRGLSLFGSFMEAQVEPGPGIANLEWTLEFRNVSARPREARAQISLPHGAAASGLSLWIDGEEREAAFGGRSQVRKAYQEVAVVQRRDPALLTSPGQDRVLLQCFPVPAGGTLRVKVGVTAPLVVRGGKMYLRLPHFAERNFSVPSGVAHSVRVEPAGGANPAGVSFRSSGSAGSTLQLRLTEAELGDASKGAVEIKAPATPGGVYEGNLGRTVARMTWVAEPAAPAAAVCLVVDGSADMADAGIDWSAVCRALPGSARVGVVFAGQRVEKSGVEGDRLTANNPGLADSLGRWLSGRDYAGGCDPVPALEEALTLVSRESGGVVLWIHGPLPLRLSSAHAAAEQLRRSGGGAGAVRVLSVGVRPGPNRVEEELDDTPGFECVPVLESAGATLAYAAARCRAADAGRAWRLALAGETLDSTSAPPVAASGQLVRLAVYDAVRNLCRAGGKENVEKATRLAVSTRLVTAASGAVVLETREQYERHDLEPSAEPQPSMGDIVPEPGALLVLAAGLLGLAVRRRRGE